MQNISYHLTHISESGELQSSTAIKKNLIPSDNCDDQGVLMYNLDAIVLDDQRMKGITDSRARNPRVQNMLRMIGYGENLGSGFPLILSAWKEAGWGNPVLENKIELDEVELVLPVAASNMSSRTDNNDDTDGEIQLSERQQDILSWINADGDTTATKMAKLFGISKRTIDMEISFLRKNGYIRKETKDNRSPWLVVKKY